MFERAFKNNAIVPVRNYVLHRYGKPVISNSGELSQTVLTDCIVTTVLTPLWIIGV